MDEKTDDNSVDSMVQRQPVSDDPQVDLSVHDDTEKITLKETEKIDEDSVESMVQNPPVSGDSQAELSLEADTQKITVKEIDEKTDDNSVDSMVQKQPVSDDPQVDLLAQDDTEKMTLKETEKIDDDSVESIVQNPPVSEDSQADLSLEADTEKITVKGIDEKTDDNSLDSMVQKQPVSDDPQLDLLAYDDTEKITLKGTEKIDDDSVECMVQNPPVSGDSQADLSLEADTEKITMKEVKCTYVRVNNLPAMVKIELLKTLFQKAVNIEIQDETWQATLLFYDLSNVERDKIKKREQMLKKSNVTVDIRDTDEQNRTKVGINNLPKNVNKELLELWFPMAEIQESKMENCCAILMFPELSYANECLIEHGDLVLNNNKLTLEILDDIHDKELKHTLRYVCVNNLPANVDNERLKMLFPMAEDREIQKNEKGCAILTFPDNASARQCLMEQRGLKIENKQLTMYILNHQQMVARKKSNDSTDKLKYTFSRDVKIPKGATSKVRGSITEINRTFGVKVSMAKKLGAWIMTLTGYSDTVVSLAAIVRKYVFFIKFKGSLMDYILAHDIPRSPKLVLPVHKQKPLPLMDQILEPPMRVQTAHQSPPLIGQSHQSHPRVRPTRRSTHRPLLLVHPTRQSLPLVRPTRRPPPLVHPTHQSPLVVHPTRQPLLDTPPFHQPPDVYLRPQHQPFMHMAPEIYQPPIHVPPVEQAPVHLPEDYHQLLQSQAPGSSSSQLSLHEEMRKQITTEILAKLAPRVEVPTRSKYEDMEAHIMANVMAQMTELISQEVVSSNMETSARHRNDSHDTRGQHRGDLEYQTIELSPKRRRYDEDSAVQEQDLRELLAEKRRQRIQKHHSLCEKEPREEETWKRPRFDDHEGGLRTEHWREEERIHQGYHAVWKKDVVEEGNNASSDLQSPAPRPPPMVSAPLMPAVPHPQPAMSTHGNVPYLDMSVYHPRLAEPPVPAPQGMYGVKPAPPIPPPQWMYGVRPAPPIPPLQGMYGVKPAPPIPPQQGMYGVKPAPPIPPPQGLYGVRPLSLPADIYGNNSGQLHGGMQSMVRSNKSAASHRKMIHGHHKLASGMRPGMGAEKRHKIGSGRQATMCSKQKKEHESSPSSKPSVNVQAAGLDLRALLARAQEIRAQEQTK